MDIPDGWEQVQTPAGVVLKQVDLKVVVGRAPAGYKSVRERRLAAGLCGWCNTVRAEGSKLKCQQHLDAANAYQRGYNKAAVKAVKKAKVKVVVAKPPKQGKFASTLVALRRELVVIDRRRAEVVGVIKGLEALNGGVK